MVFQKREMDSYAQSEVCSSICGRSGHVVGKIFKNIFGTIQGLKPRALCILSHFNVKLKRQFEENLPIKVRFFAHNRFSAKNNPVYMPRPNYDKSIIT